MSRAYALCYGPHPGHPPTEFRYWTLDMPDDYPEAAYQMWCQYERCPECGRAASTIERMRIPAP